MFPFQSFRDIHPVSSIPDVCIPTQEKKKKKKKKKKKEEEEEEEEEEEKEEEEEERRRRRRRKRRRSHNDVSIMGRRRWVPSLTCACRLFVRIRLAPPLLLSFLLKQEECMDTAMELCRSQVIKYQSRSHGYLNAEIILVMTE